MTNEVVKIRRGRVLYRIPGFQNFGSRREELERERFRRMMGGPEQPKKLGAALEGSASKLDTAARQAEKSLEENRKANPALANLLESAMAEMLKLLAESTKDVERELAQMHEQTEEMSSDVGDAPSPRAKDPQLLEILLDDDQEWSDTVQAKVDGFLNQWPTLRPKIRQAVFEAYRKAYDDIWVFAGGEEYDKINLPDPTGPEVIEDLFELSAIHLRSNSDVIALTGYCTWEDEHGLGIRIENGNVIDIGYADLAYEA